MTIKECLAAMRAEKLVALPEPVSPGGEAAVMAVPELLVEIQEAEGFSPFEEKAADMFHGDATPAWLEQEVYSLRHFIESEIGVTVADGGEIWRGLRNAFGIKGNLLVRKFFSKKTIER